jgi:cytochrome c-type biogenesis protein
VLGGVFTAAVGVLLLTTGGTTSLGGVLGASRQARLEAWVMRATDDIPDLLFVLVALLALGGAWALSAARGGRRTRAHDAHP